MIGYRHFISNSIIWRSIHGGAIPISFPSKEVTIDVESAKKIRKENNLDFVRWEDHFDTTEKLTEWWHVIKDKPDTLNSLPSKTRNMVKRALEKFIVVRVSVEIIQKLGYSVYLDAYTRYSTNERKYNNNEFLEAIKDLPENTEWWGVFDKEKGGMVGFSENFIHNNKCFFVTMWHRPNSMKLFSSYLHFFEMERYYLIEQKFDFISDGARSINHDTNIHDFLISKFKYRKAYASLRIVYKPYVQFILSLIIYFRPLMLKFKWMAKSRLMLAVNQEWIRRSCLYTR